MIEFKSKFTIRVPFTVTLIVSLTCCRVSKPEQSLDSIQLIIKYPIVTLLEEKLNFLEINDTVTIDSYKNFVLYKLPANRKFENNEKVTGTETYFVFKKKNKYGIWLKGLDTIGKKRVLVDSFLNAKAFATARFDINPSDTLVGTVQSNQKLLILKYVPKRKQNEMTFDSIYYHFNTDLNKVDYTFSKILDSTKRSKLYKVQLIYNAAYSQNHNRLLPKREFLFEIRRIPPNNLESKITLIEGLLKTEL